jgi:hypothetical protein
MVSSAPFAQSNQDSMNNLENFSRIRSNHASHEKSEFMKQTVGQEMKNKRHASHEGPIKSVCEVGQLWEQCPAWNTPNEGVVQCNRLSFAGEFVLDRDAVYAIRNAS